MKYCVFNEVCVAGISAVVPAQTIYIEDELQYYGHDRQKIKRIKAIAGLDARRVAPEGVTASDMCIQAARRLVDAGVCEPASTDAIIFVTQTPDYLAPATAFLQQTALGIPENCAVMDINLGCSGYIYGLWLAGSMIQSGACRQVLLLAGDAWGAYLRTSNRIVTPIFGDAGSATVLLHDDTASPLSFSLGSDGRGCEAIMRPGGGARIPHLLANPDDGYEQVVEDHNGNPWSVGGYGNVWMDGKAVFDFSMDVIPKHIREHLACRHITPQELDFLILHQANRQIVENIARSSGFELSQAPWGSLSKFGNQACASVPSVICDQLKSRCDAGEQLRLMLCGYGIGFSWGSCIGDFSGIKCCGIHDFVAPCAIPTRQERISYWHNKFTGENGHDR